jgi:hypothetical protein
MIQAPLDIPDGMFNFICINNSTQWKEVFPENLIVAHLAKRFAAFFKRALL